jgi:hypothetical protein
MKEPFDLNSIKNPGQRPTKALYTPEELVSLEKRYTVSTRVDSPPGDQSRRIISEEEVSPQKDQTNYPKSWREGGPFLFGNMNAHEPQAWPLTALGNHFFPHFMKKLDDIFEGTFDKLESFVKFVRGR